MSGRAPSRDDASGLAHDRHSREHGEVCRSGIGLAGHGIFPDAPVFPAVRPPGCDALARTANALGRYAWFSIWISEKSILFLAAKKILILSGQRLTRPPSAGHGCIDCGRRTAPGRWTPHPAGRSRHGCCGGRIGRQGKDNREVSRRRLHGHRHPRARERRAGEARLGRPRRRLRHDLRDRPAGAARARNHPGPARGRRPPRSRDRSGSRGRGHRVAGPQVAARERRAGGPGGASCRVPRDHPRRGARGDGAPARHRHAPGRRPAGAARARLPGRVQPLAGAVAQGPRQPLGRTRAVRGASPRVRTRGRDRVLQSARVLERPGSAHDRCGRDVHRAAEPP